MTASPFSFRSYENERAPDLGALFIFQLTGPWMLT